jgi:hypothetical protein
MLIIKCVSPYANLGFFLRFMSTQEKHERCWEITFRRQTHIWDNTTKKDALKKKLIDLIWLEFALIFNLKNNDLDWLSV